MKLKSDCKVSIRNEALLLKYNKLHKVEGISVLALQQNLKLKIKCIMTEFYKQTQFCCGATQICCSTNS